MIPTQNICKYLPVSACTSICRYYALWDATDKSAAAASARFWSRQERGQQRRTSTPKTRKGRRSGLGLGATERQLWVWHGERSSIARAALTSCAALLRGRVLPDSQLAALLDACDIILAGGPCGCRSLQHLRRRTCQPSAHAYSPSTSTV